MTGTNPLDSLNFKYSMPALSPYTGGFDMSSSFSPADMGMGIFNMPVLPSAQMNSTGGIFNTNNDITQMPSPFGSFGMTPSNFDWGSFLQTLTDMQNQYIKGLKNFMQTNTEDAAYTTTGDYSDMDTEGSSKTAEELKAKWANKKPNLSDGFYNKVVSIASRIGCSPDDLMAVMNSESGINPQAVNSNGGATGLIQFMPKTAKSLGTSTAQLKKMSAEEQLVYVEKYLTQAKRNAGFGSKEQIGPGTLYALIFLPARAKRDVLTQKGENYYTQNSALGKNGMITKADLARRVRSFSA